MKKTSPIQPGVIQWQWKTLDNMSAREFYDIAKLRQQIFVIEQACLFADLDELDPVTHHLLAMDKDYLAAYSRILPPNKPKDPVYLSRICVDIAYRKHGIGHELVKQALDYIQEVFPNKEVVISAQSYLEAFYNKFGFNRIGKPYSEDDIPHIAMRWIPKGD